MDTPVRFWNITASTATTLAIAIPDGLRRATLAYKERKIKNADGTVTKYAAYPALHVDVEQFANLNIPHKALADCVRNWLESMQDEMIRELIDERRSKDMAVVTSAKSTVSSEEIGFEELLAYIASKGTGRLSEKAITAWFDASLAENLTAAILTKKPDADDEAIATILAGYRTEFGKFAAPAFQPDPKQVPMLRKALATSADDDRMAQRLMEKLTAKDKKVTKALVDLFD